jgi:hypothetical protein
MLEEQGHKMMGLLISLGMDSPPLCNILMPSNFMEARIKYMGNSKIEF